MALASNTKHTYSNISHTLYVTFELQQNKTKERNEKRLVKLLHIFTHSWRRRSIVLVIPVFYWCATLTTTHTTFGCARIVQQFPFECMNKYFKQAHQRNVYATIVLRIQIILYNEWAMGFFGMLNFKTFCISINFLLSTIIFVVFKRKITFVYRSLWIDHFI